MSSYLSNLLTSTTSRYDSLRRNLLSSEADGDTEDDSHISRSLRAYYTEKGRPFPPWLPPDPKAPQSAPAQFVSSSGRQQQQQQQQYGGGGGAPLRGGGLSDLWDAPQQQQQQQQEPLSLRRAQGRGGGGAGRPFGGSRSTEPQAQGRPLPSQRAGSYQSSYEPAEQSPPPSSGSGMTAQERLKARLWGSGRSTSPAQSAASSTSSFSQPPAPAQGRFDRGDRDDRGGGGRLPYPDDRSGGYSQGGGGGGGRQGGRQQDSFGMSANSPWSGNDDPYAPSYDGPQQQRQRPPGGGRVGLPSGPRMR